MHPHAPRPLSGGPGRSQLSAQMNGRLLVLAIQRGTIAITAISATATIASVDVANSRLRNLGQTYTSAADNVNQYFARLVFTNATTLTSLVNTSTGGNTNTTAYEVSTHPNWVYKSIQRGTLAGGGGTATIAAVVMANTEVDNHGFSTTTVTANATAQLESVVLTNATTITSGVGTANATVGYQSSEYN